MKTGFKKKLYQNIYEIVFFKFKSAVSTEKPNWVGNQVEVSLKKINYSLNTKAKILHENIY